jgi:PPP family 3-phenylpropionic acid transporter
MPLVVLGCVAGYALLARRLPAPPQPEAPPRLGDLAGLLRNRPLAVLLVAGMIHWGCTAPFHLLLGVQVRDLGLPSWVTGVAMAVAVGAEIAALVAYPRLEGRFSSRALFAVAFGATSVRWALTGPARSAAPLIAVQAFHAFTFGIFWGGSVRAMVRLVPSRLRATGQALFTAVVFGAGNALGYPLAGRGYDRYGAVAPLYAWAAALEILALLLVLLAFPASPPAARDGEPEALST